MVRKYVRKGPRPWRDKDKRMTAAVRLRTEGKSLREIGAVLRVTEGTIRNDLKRWAERQSATPSNVIPLRKSGAQSCPPGGEITQPDYAPIALSDRRK